MGPVDRKTRYEREGLWGSLAALPDIRQKVDVFKHTIPDDVETILDVGCGDGAITNELNRHWKVTGVDSSRAALAHVTAEAVEAEASALPFPDKSFDLVLSSQMLEHLNADDYLRAVAEIRRVARRYVLISVPYREDLGMRLVRCPRCGWQGHVWWHRRRFTIDSLVRDLAGWDPLDVRLFGEMQEPPWPRAVLWTFHNVFRGFYTWPGQNAVCERCGNDDFAGVRGFPPRSDQLKRWIDRAGRRSRRPFWLSVLARRPQEPDG